jgi:hypothetical protein
LASRKVAAARALGLVALQDVLFEGLHHQEVEGITQRFFDFDQALFSFCRRTTPSASASPPPPSAAARRPPSSSNTCNCWSIRKLAAYPRRVHGRAIRIGREALRCLLLRRGMTFQRTKTWKESPDPDRDAKLDRIEEVLECFPDRVFAFDEFGPLGIWPTAGSCWAKQGKPDRLPAAYRRTHGVTHFHGCCSVGDDRLWGVNRRRKGTANTLAALKSIRAAGPDGAPIYIILDNLSAHTSGDIRRWAKKNKAELCFTPTYASWANPIEAHFGCERSRNSALALIL